MRSIVVNTITSNMPIHVPFDFHQCPPISLLQTSQPHQIYPYLGSRTAHASCLEFQNTYSHSLSISFLEYMPHPRVCPPTPPKIHPPFLSMNQCSRYRPEIPSLSAVHQPSGHHEHNPLNEQKLWQIKIWLVLTISTRFGTSANLCFRSLPIYTDLVHGVSSTRIQMNQ